MTTKSKNIKKFVKLIVENKAYHVTEKLAVKMIFSFGESFSSNVLLAVQKGDTIVLMKETSDDFDSLIKSYEAQGYKTYYKKVSK